MKNAREIKVGILAVIAIFLLYFGFNFLKGVNIFSSTHAFYGKYSNLNGLVEQSPVYVRGYKVGHRLRPHRPRRVDARKRARTDVERGTDPTH